MSMTEDRSQEMQFLGYDCGLAATCVDLHHETALLVRRVHGETRPHYEPIAVDFAALATKHIAGVEDAGALLIVGRGEWRCASEPGSNAALVEHLHKNLGEGPAIDAAKARRMVSVADVAVDTRWPRFTAAVAADTPVRSLICIPLYTHIHSWGALMLLSAEANSLDDDTERAGAILATHAALTLEAMHHDRQYRSALGSRDIIGQAKGVLMERCGLDAAASFALLTRLADESRRPVVVVAKEILDSRLAPKV